MSKKIRAVYQRPRTTVVNLAALGVLDTGGGMGEGGSTGGGRNAKPNPSAFDESYETDIWSD